MKKILIGLTAIMLMSLVSAMPENFGGNGDAWENDYGNHYVNNHNPENRKDWDSHMFAVPGHGGMHANEHSAVVEWGDGTLVDPHDNV